MPFITVGSSGDDLTVKIPSKRTTDWATEFLEEFVKKIVAHDHTGSGRGAQLGAGSIADNSITSSKILLADTTAIRWDVGGIPTDIISYDSTTGFLTINADFAVSKLIANSETTLTADSLPHDFGIDLDKAVVINYVVKQAGIEDLYDVGTVMLNEDGEITHSYNGSEIIEFSLDDSSVQYTIATTADIVTIEYTTLVL